MVRLDPLELALSQASEGSPDDRRSSPRLGASQKDIYLRFRGLDVSWLLAGDEGDPSRNVPVNPFPFTVRESSHTSNNCKSPVDCGWT